MEIASRIRDIGPSGPSPYWTEKHSGSLCHAMFAMLTTIPHSSMSILFQQLSQIDSRAVQLGSLFIRGLATLITANSACGFPFKMDDLMPWYLFDGNLFQEKYQQIHRGCPLHELLEGNVSTLC